MSNAFHFADWVSAEAQAYYRTLFDTAPPPLELAELRVHYDAYNRRLLEEASEAYAVNIEAKPIAGVPFHRVTPRGGATSDRVLLCLHGGAFMWGTGAGALLEAVPMAAVTGCEVLAVDYRLAPEHIFPAAVEDVLAVYADLLTRCDPSKVGIYGCSAGGVLTAQTVAALIAEGRPVPGAIAMLHGTAVDFGGDAVVIAHTFDPREDPGETPSAANLPYFATADLSDARVLPGNHPDMLAQFPPSLLISGTRDFAASACAVMHRRLLAAGTEAEFVLFDGMWHAHHMATLLPESRETFAIIDRFFMKYLG